MNHFSIIKILCWPKSSFGTFRKSVWKNPNKLFGQPNSFTNTCFPLLEIFDTQWFLNPYIMLLLENLSKATSTWSHIFHIVTFISFLYICLYIEIYMCVYGYIYSPQYNHWMYAMYWFLKWDVKRFVYYNVEPLGRNIGFSDFYI